MEVGGGRWDDVRSFKLGRLAPLETLLPHGPAPLVKKACSSE